MRILVISAALFATACGQAAPPAEAPAQPPAPVEQMPVIPTDPAAGPSGADNMTWTFDPMGRGAGGASRPRLMYRSGGSEGMMLNLQCDPGTNNGFVLSMRDARQDSYPFTLQSGTVATELSAAPIQPDNGGAGEIAASAPVALDAPALTAFRSSGDLTITDNGRSFVLDAINDQERQTIAEFFRACS